MSTETALIVIFSCLFIGFFIGYVSKKKYDEIKKSYLSLHELSIDAEFDIEGLDVIAVERGFSSNKTLISWDFNGVLNEFYMYVTNEKHNEFVDRFKKKVQSKSNT